MSGDAAAFRERGAAAGAGAFDRAPREPGAPLRLSARKGTRIVLLDPADILWFEAEETLVFARTEEGRFLVDRTLADLAAWLGEPFFRAHRRFLVRLDRIGEIRPQEGGTFLVTLRDAAGTALPLSRRQARRLRGRFAW
jgi:DNA-binding LytR/AlgR family response regulator